MTLTLLDPRQALWERRKVTLEKLATLRTYRGALCGCQRCGDSGKIEEIDCLIAKAEAMIDELTDAITDGERIEGPNVVAVR